MLISYIQIYRTVLIIISIKIVELDHTREDPNRGPNPNPIPSRTHREEREDELMS